MGRFEHKKETTLLENTITEQIEVVRAKMVNAVDSHNYNFTCETIVLISQKLDELLLQYQKLVLDVPKRSNDAQMNITA